MFTTDDLTNMANEAETTRYKELEGTRKLTRDIDASNYPQINLKGQEFWLMLQELEDEPTWHPRLLAAMRREEKRRQDKARRER